ncbi:S-adenosyl-L-methionine-dependent methyltransferase [Calycina marina]|uniref:S-adenosyl-L-methionine-dependent methyltransferase n=1 Tax=Calycina marina TaxID=1763456 RepID=A0A9P7Z9I7_9HELO|nr:S-adenosyl-L-methionine-dependent methyltransferase [Calycina marina]
MIAEKNMSQSQECNPTTLGFLIHPNIPNPSAATKIADIGAGSGAWLLSVAKLLPATTQLGGFDVSFTAFPPSQIRASNVTFMVHDMLFPFPPSEPGTYDIVSVRFVSVSSTRSDWARAIQNLSTLLKPGGWLQWIDSCNFSLYNSTPGTSRAACQEMYDVLEPLRMKEDIVIGMLMKGVDMDLVDVHEDVFSTDRLQDPDLRIREKGTVNMIDCPAQCMTKVRNGGGERLEYREHTRAKAESDERSRRRGLSYGGSSLHCRKKTQR